MRERSRLCSRTRPAVGLLLLVILVACSSTNDRDVELDEEEQRLVLEVVQLARVRVERARDEAKSDSLLKDLPPLYSDAEIEALLDRLSQDTEHGAAVMEAIHDSLESLRDVVFPPPTRPGVNRN